MGSSRKSLVQSSTVEWAKHLRPKGKRQFWKAERQRAKNFKMREANLSKSLSHA